MPVTPQECYHFFNSYPYVTFITFYITSMIETYQVEDGRPFHSGWKNPVTGFMIPTFKKFATWCLVQYLLLLTGCHIVCYWILAFSNVYVPIPTLLLHVIFNFSKKSKFLLQFLVCL